MNINYDYYRIFYFVAKYGNISQAAKLLLNNQPNLTRTIKNLESELGCPLFSRTNRGMRLTPEGQKLYDRLLTCKNPMKEKVVLGGMHVLGCYDILEGQVMRKKANPACRESTTRLMELYQKALDETPAILENLYQCLYGTGTTLSSRFLRDYH